MAGNLTYLCPYLYIMFFFFSWMNFNNILATHYFVNIPMEPWNHVVKEFSCGGHDHHLAGKNESTETINQLSGDQNNRQRRYPLHANNFPFENKTRNWVFQFILRLNTQPLWTNEKSNFEHILKWNCRNNYMWA